MLSCPLSRTSRQDSDRFWTSSLVPATIWQLFGLKNLSRTR